MHSRVPIGTSHSKYDGWWQVHSMVLPPIGSRHENVLTLWGQGIQVQNWCDDTRLLSCKTDMYIEQIKSATRSLDFETSNQWLQHCLPQCEETDYITTVSAAPFRPCDFKNFGMSPMCDVSTVITSATGELEVMENARSKPPTTMWGGGVIEKYR